MSLVEEVKRKKEFSGLPDSIIKRSLKESGNDIKLSRKLLRKYFGVFLTNKILRGKGDILNVHMSSRKREYKEFYSKIFKDIGDVNSIIDLGCGVNGFSYKFLPEGVEYLGIEAAEQLVNQMNIFFEKNNFNAHAIKGDLFDVKMILNSLGENKKNKVIFMFQVIDALENMERNFSKKLICAVIKKCKFLIITLPLFSLGGRKKFAVDRKWLVDFLIDNFNIEKDFKLFGERILIIKE